MRHVLEEMTFDSPPGWKDRTIVSFSAPASFGVKTPASVVVVRESLRPGETLMGFVRRQLAELSITPIEAYFVELAGLPAYHVSYALKTENDEVERTTSFVETRSRTASVVTHISTMCNKAEAPLYRATFDAMLASLRFDRQSFSEPPPPPPDFTVPSFARPPISSEVRRSDEPAPPMPDIPMPGWRQRR